MKKFFSVILAVLMLTIGLAACSGNKDDETDISAAPAGTPEEVIESIYKEKPVDLSLITISVDLTDSYSVKAYTGLDDASKIKEAAVSESMLGSQAYSLVAVRLNSADDAENVANDMLNGIDQRKWICVEADNLKVMAKDDLVVLFMVDSTYSDSVTVDDMEAAFTKLCGGNLDLVLDK